MATRLFTRIAATTQRLRKDMCEVACALDSPLIPSLRIGEGSAMLTSVEGIYRDGRVEFLEVPSNLRDEMRVIVTFLDAAGADHSYTGHEQHTMRATSGPCSSPSIVPIPNDGVTGERGGRPMMPFSQCPVCGGEMIEKDVEKLLRGGVHTAVLTVRAEVCLRCGERLYPQETVRRFEQIRAKLERQDVAGFQPVGRSFQVS
jgi:YgiT-type zinc finger domain-containing protein